MKPLRPDSLWQKTHALLLKRDQGYAAYYELLDNVRRERQHQIWHEISQKLAPPSLVSARHGDASKALRRITVVVQEKEFEYGRVRHDWPYVVTDTVAMRGLYSDAIARLETFLAGKCSISPYAFYGGVKPEASLAQKLSELGAPIKDLRARPEALDIWDVVRFRMVFIGVRELVRASVDLWTTFMDDIVRCRNYYFRPRMAFEFDAYRAVHFELVDAAGRVVELQLMTLRRECVSVIDHPFIFKGSLPFLDLEHESWLRACSFVANILDYEEAVATGAPDVLKV